jgi:hypothetical protein
MGFGKKFKSLFIVDEEEDSDAQKKAEQNTRATNANPAQPSAPVTQPTQRQVQPQPQQSSESPKKTEDTRNYFQPEQPAKLSMKIGKGEQSTAKPQSEPTADAEPQSGNVKRQILKMISDVIDENNIPGTDYYELNKIIESPDFIKAIPDKNARTISAFYSLKAQDPKVTKQSILNSIDYYKDVVNKEYQNVLSSYNATVEAQVNAPRKEIEKLTAQKQELLDRIATIDKQVSVLQQEITDKTLELNNKKADYDASFDLVIKNLNEEKTELNNILQ